MNRHPQPDDVPEPTLRPSRAEVQERDLIARSGDTPVTAVMSRRVITVSRDLTLGAALELLLDRGISGVPVVDERGRPIGMLSKTDLLRERDERGRPATLSATSPDEEGFLPPDWEQGFHVVGPEVTVGEVMTPLAMSLPATASVAQAAALMAYEGVHRAPVVDEEGKMAGIVTPLDVLRWLGQASGYLSAATEGERRRLR